MVSLAEVYPLGIWFRSESSCTCVSISIGCVNENLIFTISNNGFLFYVNYVSSTSHIDAGYLGTSGSFAANNSNNGAPMANGEWNHCCVVMKSNTFHLYVNGKEHSFTWTGSSVNWSTRWTSPHVVIGNRAGLEAANDPALPLAKNIISGMTMGA